jgi:hypothetical protein
MIFFDKNGMLIKKCLNIMLLNAIPCQQDLS